MYYIYTAHNGRPEAKFYSDSTGDYYLFKEKPSYETIEKYDLRFKRYGRVDRR